MAKIVIGGVKEEAIMIARRVRSDPKARSQSKPMTLAPPARSRLFGEPQLLGDEDRAVYDELLARIYAAIKPVDILDEMFIADVMSLECEVLRWRRLKATLIRAHAFNAVAKLLSGKLDYDLYRDHFFKELANILQDVLPDEQSEDAQTLARKCARDDPAAVEKVNKVLADKGLDLDVIADGAQARKAQELVQDYGQSEPDAVERVNEFLTDAGTSIDALMADALTDQLDNIERIDHLTTVAESRRNASLYEIERRRAVLGATLRRNVQEIEDGEIVMLETTPAKRKNAA